VLQALRELLYIDETFVVFEIRPEQVNPVTPTLSAGRWSAGSSLVAAFPHVSSLPAGVIAEMKTAPPMQKIHWIEVDGRLASFGFSTPWEGAWRLSEARSSIDVPTGSVCLTTFETLPDLRGHRLYQSVLTAMLLEHFGRGARRAYIWCRRDNLPSYRAITRVGFRETAIHRYRRLLGLARLQVELIDR
jgi:hypothetical protein